MAAFTLFFLFTGRKINRKGFNFNIKNSVSLLKAKMQMKPGRFRSSLTDESAAFKETNSKQQPF